MVMECQVIVVDTVCDQLTLRRHVCGNNLCGILRTHAELHTKKVQQCALYF